jgi:hypothetical protein
MTQDEIIQMARDSGMELYGLGKDRARFVHHLEAFAKLVEEKATAIEREACVKVCEEYDGEYDIHPKQTAEGIALQIRARGQA